MTNIENNNFKYHFSDAQSEKIGKEIQIWQYAIISLDTNIDANYNVNSVMANV